MEFQSLGEKERKLLLKALDMDFKNLKCQFCDEKVKYDECMIAPPTDTKELATITCTSPLCVSTYLTKLEAKE